MKTMPRTYTILVQQLRIDVWFILVKHQPSVFSSCLDNGANVKKMISRY